MTFIWCSIFNIAAAADVDTGATNEVENVDETEEDDDAKEESGTCGENLTWVLDEEGTLTISGTGEMNSWSGDSSDESGNGRAPWDDENVHRIGDYSVGYTIEDDEDGNTVKLPVEGFKIYGYSGSAAETYADSTEFEFVPLDGAEDELIIVPEKTNSTYVQGSGKDLVIYCTGEFSKFVSAEMDGQLIDPSNYTVEEGSTVLTLVSTYLDTLSVGKHVVTLNYVDGSISCDIMILRADQANSEKNEGTLQTNGTEQGNQNKVVGNSVKTGDSSHAMIWLMLIMVSMLVSVITCAQVKKK